jgi:hypothetical protein
LRSAGLVVGGSQSTLMVTLVFGSKGVAASELVVLDLPAVEVLLLLEHAAPVKPIPATSATATSLR